MARSEVIAPNGPHSEVPVGRVAIGLIVVPQPVGHAANLIGSTGPPRDAAKAGFHGHSVPRDHAVDTMVEYLG